MPLNRPKETLIRFIQRFCQPVRRNCHDGKSRRKSVDRLMMVTVYRKMLRSKALIQGRICYNTDEMGVFVIRRCLMVFYIRRMLCRQILVQRSAQSCIDELDATADPQKRFVSIDGFLKNNSFHPITLRAVGNQSGQRFFAVYLRGNIVSAGKKKTIAHPYKLIQFLFFC